MSKAAFKRMMRERSAPLVRAAPVEVPRFVTPTDEQLSNFVAAVVNAEAAKALGGAGLLLTPRLAGLMLEANPEAKRGWLQRHREMQEAAWAMGAGS
jgi:hypothetical protein